MLIQLTIGNSFWQAYPAIAIYDNFGGSFDSSCTAERGIEVQSDAVAERSAAELAITEDAIDLLVDTAVLLNTHTTLCFGECNGYPESTSVKPSSRDAIYGDFYPLACVSADGVTALADEVEVTLSGLVSATLDGLIPLPDEIKDFGLTNAKVYLTFSPNEVIVRVVSDVPFTNALFGDGWRLAFEAQISAARVATFADLKTPPVKVSDGFSIASADGERGMVVSLGHALPDGAIGSVYLPLTICLKNCNRASRQEFTVEGALRVTFLPGGVEVRGRLAYFGVIESLLGLPVTLEDPVVGVGLNLNTLVPTYIEISGSIHLGYKNNCYDSSSGVWDKVSSKCIHASVDLFYDVFDVPSTRIDVRVSSMSLESMMNIAMNFVEVLVGKPPGSIADAFTLPGFLGNLEVSWNSKFDGKCPSATDPDCKAFFSAGLLSGVQASGSIRNIFGSQNIMDFSVAGSAYTGVDLSASGHLSIANVLTIDATLDLGVRAINPKLDFSLVGKAEIPALHISADIKAVLKTSIRGVYVEFDVSLSFFKGIVNPEATIKLKYGSTSDREIAKLDDESSRGVAVLSAPELAVSIKNFNVGIVKINQISVELSGSSFTLSAKVSVRMFVSVKITLKVSKSEITFSATTDLKLITWTVSATVGINKKKFSLDFSMTENISGAIVALAGEVAKAVGAAAKKALAAMSEFADHISGLASKFAKCLKELVTKFRICSDADKKKKEAFLKKARKNIDRNIMGKVSDVSDLVSQCPPKTQMLRCPAGTPSNAISCSPPTYSSDDESIPYEVLILRVQRWSFDGVCEVISQARTVNLDKVDEINAATDSLHKEAVEKMTAVAEKAHEFLDDFIDDANTVGDNINEGKWNRDFKNSPAEIKNGAGFTGIRQVQEDLPPARSDKTFSYNTCSGRIEKSGFSGFGSDSLVLVDTAHLTLTCGHGSNPAPLVITGLPENTKLDLTINSVVPVIVEIYSNGDIGEMKIQGSFRTQLVIHSANEGGDIVVGKNPFGEESVLGLNPAVSSRALTFSQIHEMTIRLAQIQSENVIIEDSNIPINVYSTSSTEYVKLGKNRNTQRVRGLVSLHGDVSNVNLVADNTEGTTGVSGSFKQSLLTGLTGSGVALPGFASVVGEVTIMLPENHANSFTVLKGAPRFLLTGGDFVDDVTLIGMSYYSVLSLGDGNDALTISQDDGFTTVDSGAGYDTLHMTGDCNNQACIMTQTKVIGAGSSIGAVLEFLNFEISEVDLTRGVVKEEITTRGVVNEDIATTTTHDDIVNVQGVLIPTTVWLGIGDNTISISSRSMLGTQTDADTAQLPRGDLSSVVAKLTLNCGVDGRNRLLVSDHGGEDAKTVEVDVDHVTSIDKGNVEAIGSIKGLTGSGDIWFTGSSFSRGIAIWTGKGDDKVTVSGIYADGVAALYTGSGNDEVDIDLQSGVTMACHTGPGEDVIRAESTTIPLVLLGGSGGDAIFPGQSEDLVFGDNGFASYGNDAFELGNLHGFDSPPPAGGGDAALLREAVCEEGGEGKDVITSTDGSHDVIFGGGGDDKITTGIGADIIFGDSGSASFNEQSLATSLRSGAEAGGSDVISSGSSEDIIIAGGGDDHVVSTLGDDIVLGDHGSVELEYVAGIRRVLEIHAFPAGLLQGKDEISSGNGDDTVLGGNGRDLINSGDGADIVFGDHGLISFDGTTSVITSTNYTEIGHGNRDIIHSEDGSDVIFGGQGGDEVDSGLGDDTVFGDFGRVVYRRATSFYEMESVAGVDQDADDDIVASGGSDKIFGCEGADRMDGGSGSDVIFGDHGRVHSTIEIGTVEYESSYHRVGGNDSIDAGTGDDFVFGGQGPDYIEGKRGDDTIFGDHGSVTLSGESMLATSSSPYVSLSVTGGADVIKSHAGNDVVFGGGYNDEIDSDTGDDVVFGDSGWILVNLTSPEMEFSSTFGDNFLCGDDRIHTGSGNDYVVGGSGDDKIFTHSGDNLVFGDNGNMQINLESQYTSMTSLFSYTAGKDTIESPFGNSIIFGGSSSDQITASSGKSIIFGDHGTLTRTPLETQLESLFGDESDGGDDTISTAEGADIILGGQGSDTIEASSGENTIFGDHGKVTIDARETVLEAIFGEDSQGSGDQIATLGGSDMVFGGQGSDVIAAGSGDNVVFGDFGMINKSVGISEFATLFAEWGGDDSIVTLAPGSQKVFGGARDDVVSTSSGNDIIFGDFGEILLIVGDGAETRIRTLNGSKGLDSGPFPEGGRDSITTSNGDNVILGGQSEDYILTAGAGNDVIFGDFGEVVVVDGAGKVMRTLDEPSSEGGSDNITSSKGDNVVFGGQSSDLITTTGSGDNVVFGDFGKVTVTAALTTYESTAAEHGGGDHIRTLVGEDHIFGGAADDVITTGLGSDVVFGDFGRVRFSADSKSIESISTEPVLGGTDTIETSEGDDIIIAGQHGDQVFSHGGLDWVLGDHGIVESNRTMRMVSSSAFTSGGADTVDSGTGDDYVIGGFDGDVLSGNDGHDFIFGDNAVIVLPSNSSEPRRFLPTSPTTNEPAHDDVISGGAGNDFIVAQQGRDKVNGNGGHDMIFGDHAEAALLSSDERILYAASVFPTPEKVANNDELFGDDGEDYIFGGDGGDSVSGGNGLDVILGDHGMFDRDHPDQHKYESIFTTSENGGNDVLNGGEGDDIILGQQGSDTINGGNGDDDITGGHDVLHGADSADVIYGGSGSDVVLGDNGRILRQIEVSPSSENSTSTSSTSTSTSTSTCDAAVVGPPGAPYSHAIRWARYFDEMEVEYEALNSILRTVQRYDDIDLVEGDDEIHGGDGQDVLHGQRGNDFISGGAGDDEIYGELGSDTLHGDGGQDTILGDTGSILRSFLENGRPRLNPITGSWHRNIVLEDVSYLKYISETSKTHVFSEDEALSVLNLDVLVSFGTFNTTSGTKHMTSVTAWETMIAGLELVKAGDDEIHGGDGNDWLIGQRGADKIFGDDGEDVIYGDDVSSSYYYDSCVPLVLKTLRILPGDDASAFPVEIGFFGEVIHTPLQILPEQVTRSHAMRAFEDSAIATTFADEYLLMLGAAGVGDLVRTDFSELSLRPHVSMIPDAARHVDELFGSDELHGGAGNDLITGDTAFYHAFLNLEVPELVTLREVAAARWDEIEVRWALISADAGTLEHQRGKYGLPNVTRIGNDQIYGDGGNDTLIGDALEGFIDVVQFGDLEFDSMVDTVTQLMYIFNDYETIAVDTAHFLYELHHSIITSLYDLRETQERAPLHEFHFSNDVINGGDGNDLITGDTSVLVTKGVAGSVATYSFGGEFDPSLFTRNVFSDVLHLMAHQLHDHVVADFDASPEIPNIHDRTMWNLLPKTTWGSDTAHGGDGDDSLIGDYSLVSVTTFDGYLFGPSGHNRHRKISDVQDGHLQKIVKLLEDRLVNPKHKGNYRHTPYRNGDFEWLASLTWFDIRGTFVEGSTDDDDNDGDNKDFTDWWDWDKDHEDRSRGTETQWWKKRDKKDKKDNKDNKDNKGKKTPAKPRYVSPAHIVVEPESELSLSDFLYGEGGNDLVVGWNAATVITLWKLTNTVIVTDDKFYDLTHDSFHHSHWKRVAHYKSCHKDTPFGANTLSGGEQHDIIIKDRDDTVLDTKKVYTRWGWHWDDDWDDQHHHHSIAEHLAQTYLDAVHKTCLNELSLDGVLAINAPLYSHDRYYRVWWGNGVFGIGTFGNLYRYKNHHHRVLNYYNRYSYHAYLWGYGWTGHFGRPLHYLHHDDDYHHHNHYHHDVWSYGHSSHHHGRHSHGWRGDNDDHHDWWDRWSF